MPRRHLGANIINNGNVKNNIGDSIAKLGGKLRESSYKEQCVMTNPVVTALGSNIPNENSVEEPYSFELHSNDTDSVSMSPLYDDPSTSMETIMDHMWENDRSNVFSFTSEVMTDLESKKMVLRMISNSTDNKTEIEFGAENFALLTVSELSHLCGSRAIRIKVEARYIIGSNIARRLQFG